MGELILLDSFRGIIALGFNVTFDLIFHMLETKRDYI